MSSSGVSFYLIHVSHRHGRYRDLPLSNGLGQMVWVNRGDTSNLDGLFFG